MNGTGHGVTSQVIAMVTAQRGGMRDADVVRMATEGILELADSPEDVPRLLSQMVGELVVLVAVGFDQWGAAVGGDPGAQLLAAMGQIAAEGGPPGGVSSAR